MEPFYESRTTPSMTLRKDLKANTAGQSEKLKGTYLKRSIPQMLLDIISKSVPPRQGQAFPLPLPLCGSAKH